MSTKSTIQIASCHYLLHTASPSWEANRFSSCQEIPRILWNPKILYFIRKCPPYVPILSQHDSIHTPKYPFLKTLFNIILPSALESPKWSLSLRCPHQNPVNASLISIRATYTTHFVIFNFITRKILGEQYWSLSYSLRSFLHSHVYKLQSVQM